MYSLKVKWNGKFLKEIELDPAKTYVAGRKEDGDIILNQDKSISREHFQMAFEGDAWTVSLLSKFGEVLFQGEKVEQQRLVVGEAFQVKGYEFELSEKQEEKAKPVDELEPKEVGNELEEKTYVGSVSQVPFIRFNKQTTENEGLLQLAVGNSWVAGRENTCAIFIDDPRVSRKQFEIKKTAGGYKIYDLESVNGTFVNGQRLGTSESKALRSGDAISVLEHVMYFELRDPYFNARVSSVDYDKVSRALVTTEDSMPSEGNFPAPMDHQMVPQGPQDPSYTLTPHMGQGQYPMAAYDPNQYQNYPPQDFQQQAPVAQGPSQQQKMRVMLIGAVAIVGIFIFMQNSDEEAPRKGGNTTQAGNPNDALNKLSAEQQTLIKQSLKLAENYYDTDNAEFCKTELAKIKDLFPDYDKSSLGKKIKELEEKAEQKIYVRVRLAEEEARAKAKAEQEQEIVRVTDLCKKKMNPQMTSDEMNTCLGPVISYDPQNLAIVTLQEQVQKMEVDRQVQAEQKTIYEGRVQQLRQLYSKAEKVEKSGSLLEAIDEYKKVVNSSLPDPASLKSKAQRNIATIKSGINSKTSSLVQQAEKMYSDKKIKEAISALRKIRQMNPLDEDIPEKIDVYVRELKKEMKVLWDESIIEENYGKILTDENNTGAVSKWKKILETDIQDGEFYQKAKNKLKKYGVQ